MPRPTSVRKTSPDTTQAVDEFMTQLEHPFKAGVEGVGQLIPGAHADIAEGILVADPEKLLQWLGKDRAMVEFATLDSIASKGEAFSSCYPRVGGACVVRRVRS